MTLRVRWIHAKPAEAEAGAVKLREAGCTVEFDPFTPELLSRMKDDAPDVVVIDLTRLPSMGRDVGIAIRRAPRTRDVPLVFVDGDPAKVARVRELLPDATFTSWRGIRGALLRASSPNRAAPVVPRSNMAAYEGTVLPKKLGIRDGAVVALLGAPRGFERTLGRLPDGVILRRGGRGRRNLTLWFCRTRSELESGVARRAGDAERGGLWILWPKRTSTEARDLTQAIVRRAAEAASLVDFKICSVDETWSGLRFSRRDR